MYSGAQPNQQILPAYDWGKEKGFKKYFLVGSDYVFPRTANLILKKHIESDKLTLSGEEYQPMGGTDFSDVIAKNKAANPDVIYSPLNGARNIAFFNQMAAAVMKYNVLPVTSFSYVSTDEDLVGEVRLSR